MKFWHCIGVKVNICPPHRPDLNAFVERYHRAYGEECLKVYQPQNLAEVNEVTKAFKEHYNWE
ncbi:MAG: transposase [Chloroflexi bacterium]|uniref:Transposase n=1 Tax=Candidatus Chlorohelix allophototropha TaxID=3003348 RepID=A0A8T7M3M7_9CHLR|nr:transposase [Chloroflexota bacterium]WJW65774.1 transposase [Chloroflexota bacterium L227-S17]